jgi:hypothetical protein
MKRRRIWLALASGWAFGACADAQAGAFMEPPGAGKIIVTSTFSNSINAFDAGGRIVPAGGYRKIDVTALAEFGVTEWLTAVVSPSFETVRAGGRSGTGPGASALGARLRVWQGSDSVLSTQATVLLPNTAERMWGNDVAALDWRWLYGRNIELAGWPGFVDLQFGLRRYESRRADEFRLDATLGLRPANGLLVLLQLFNTFDQRRARAHKLQVSAVKELTSRVALQFGLFATVAGVNAGRETGIVTGVWTRF